MQDRSDPLPRAVWIVALLSLILHLLPRSGYEFHRDELFYLAMGDHLDFLRMQFPPMIAMLAQVARLLPFSLLTAIHLLPALALVGLILLTARLTAILGGGAHAQVLAALSLLVAPLFMRTGVLFQPVVFEQLWWCLATLALVALLAGRPRTWWLLLGLAVGLSAMTKLSGVVFGVALVVGILASPLRRDLVTRWPWLAGTITLVLAAPSFLGQQHWGWPIFAQVQVLRETQLEHVTATGFITGQFLLTGIAAPLLIVGVAGLGWSATLRPYRSVLLVAAIAFALLLVERGKEYYFGPMHPALLAAGAVVAGQWLSSRRRLWVTTVIVLACGGMLLLPIGIPLLPPAQMIRYAARLGLSRVVTTNYGTALALPQDYADMTGWREQVDVVAEVFHALPPSEQAGAVIVGDNYGRAAAVALYGPALGLPYPISTHGDFYHWGPGERSGDVVIVIGDDAADLGRLFGEVTLAARSHNPLGVDEEQDVPIFVCRQPKRPLGEVWRWLGVDWG
ncbi:MAG: glycosyltransferase family 39 protein [Gemmatimonadales bacterium]